MISKDDGASAITMTATRSLFAIHAAIAACPAAHNPSRHTTLILGATHLGIITAHSMSAFCSAFVILVVLGCNNGF
ncbi:hypothetical protein KTO58_14310 [Chitinophaga pendula]|uniref:hypothetical protein n=1 Tax=Chitinophaga TaxID=79328 RepID=UPI0012FE2345|nr:MULTISPECIES: hypothetical protein [Chitinophaga]UCJ04876.1 hypothetical protein KTO58_14310 [Chitinophaga pendula]